MGMISNIAGKSSKALGLIKHGLKEHAPAILGVIGTGGTIAGTVMIANASTKVADTVEKNRTIVEEIKATDGYSTKDLNKARMKAAWDMVKLYGPGVAVETAGLGVMWGGGVMLNNRNVALTAAYAALAASFTTYRARVAGDLGVDEELNYYIGRDVSGKPDPETTEGPKVFVGDEEIHRIFNCTNRYWNEYTFDANIMFLRQKQSELNRKLRLEGFLTLNDAYDVCGFDPTDAGMVLGWVGESVVDLGIQDILDGAYKHWEYLDWNNAQIPLHFNVDGIIYGRINKKNKED